jgi:hypothetical protein
MATVPKRQHIFLSGTDRKKNTGESDQESKAFAETVEYPSKVTGFPLAWRCPD